MKQERGKDWLPSDDDWRFLLDEKEISKRRAKAEKKFENLSTDQVKNIRKIAKTDLFFLATGLLEYSRLTENFHGHYCQWLARNRAARRRMTLKPRGHFKSTENTISDSIQMAIPNDAGVTYHPYNLGTRLKLLLAHENRESASRFLFEITEAFTAKEAMLMAFPDCIPSKRNGQRVNKWELDLPRDSHSKEPTFDTLGVSGASQGKHYNWLKFDDLVGEAARDSKTVMETTNRWFANSTISLLDQRRIDGWDLTGTHYSTSDTYAQAIRIYGVNKAKSFIRNYFKKDVLKMKEGSMVVYGRAIEEEGVIAFPEEITWEDIQILKQNPKDYAAQHANNPKDSGLTLFQPDWIKFYNVGAGSRFYVFQGESSWSVDRRDLDVTIKIDPAPGDSDSGDESGIVVTGVDKQFNIYILEAYKKRFKPPELIAEMLRLYTRWWPRLISVENVNFSSIYKHWFKQKCDELRIYPNIYDYKVGQKSKQSRIAGLTHYFAAGQVYMLEGMNQLRDELEWFPLGDSEHILDALAQGQEIWKAGINIADREKAKKAVNDSTEERDALTGY